MFAGLVHEFVFEHARRHAAGIIVDNTFCKFVGINVTVEISKSGMHFSCVVSIDPVTQIFQVFNGFRRICLHGKHGNGHIPDTVQKPQNRR